jgi:hypothetical protein
MSVRTEDLRTLDTPPAIESPVTAVSWPAIWAGAAVAAAASLLLVTLGSGLGFASLSPWRGEGPSATTFTVMTAIWLIVVQWLASGLGGYITGRLRTRWAGLHTHEVAFRDTAHGFVTWAVSTLLTASLVAWAASAAISGGAKLAASAAEGAGSAGQAMLSKQDAGAYDIDTLFRSSGANANGANSDTRAEALRILTRGVSQGDVPPADRKYLADVVAAHTAVSPAEAEQRVNQAVEQAKALAVKAREAADTARKAAAAAAICTALSLLIGAFIAMVAAALGGRERDQHA